MGHFTDCLKTILAEEDGLSNHGRYPDGRSFTANDLTGCATIVHKANDPTRQRSHHDRQRRHA